MTCEHNLSVEILTRLDALIAGQIKTHSREQIKNLIKSGAVSIDGKPCLEPSFKAKIGSLIHISIPEKKESPHARQNLNLQIVFEDEFLSVLVKPRGLVVHPAPGNKDGTLINGLLHHFGDDLEGVGDSKRPGLVHRLDKDTSGLMVVAKTDLCHRALQKLFAEHDLDRRYYALVYGQIFPALGKIESHIGRSRQNRLKMQSYPMGSPHGKLAITEYKSLKLSDHHLSLLECRLHTGRTHQIRVHLSSLGHGIVGDPLYKGTKGARGLDSQGKTALATVRSQMLHAFRLGFEHPMTGEYLEFTDDMPTDMQDLMDKFF